jgi:V/A-type H+/Na+-transporting ATPase subunit D
MAKLKLSKSALQAERTQLKLYQRLLPSLDMKRRQLTIEHDKARTELELAQCTIRRLGESIGRELPMLAATDIDLTGLMTFKSRELGEENVVGVRLPVLRSIDVEVSDYSMMARPAWVDTLAKRLKESIEHRMRLNVAEQRVRILSRSLKQITQRVNLFDRILIPQTKRSIRRIRIFLGDLDRDSVVRAKLAKSRGVESAPAEARS